MKPHHLTAVSPAHEAARITLLLLRHLQGDSRLTDYSFDDAGRQSFDDEVVTALVQMAKPLRCEVIVTGNALRLRYRDMQDTERRVHAHHVARLSLAVKSALPDFLRDESQRVLLRVGTDSLVVSVAAVRQWWADYWLGDPGVNQTFDNATRKESKNAGVQYVWRVHAEPLKATVQYKGKQ